MIIKITPRPTAASLPSSEVLQVDSMPVKVVHRPLRVLDFDCECRPLHWIGSDYVSREITAIAWTWIEDPQPAPTVVLLGENGMTVRGMLERFVADYQRADIVTGHFIRGFDLPLIASALVENQMPSLEDKLAHDTKIDLVKMSGLSKSQENLGATLGLDHPKIQMNQHRWRSANRLTPEGFEFVRERAAGDVLQHIELRQRLLELGYLAPPVKWESKGQKPLTSYSAWE